MIIPERNLWQQVLQVALMDALSAHSKAETRTFSTKNRVEADLWLREAGKDFREVCHLAGIDPDYLSQAYRAGRITLLDLRGIQRRVTSNADD